MNTTDGIENTDIYRKLSKIFTDKDRKTKKNMAIGILLEINYDYYINNFDVDDDNNDLIHYLFIEDNQIVYF